MRLSRDLWTSFTEIVGGACVIAGAFVLFGVGVALIVAGLGLLAFGYLASGGAD